MMLLWIQHLVTLLPWLLLLHAHGSSGDHGDWPESQIDRVMGHYPTFYCSISNMMLVPEDTHGTFYSTNPLDVEEKCLHVNHVWTFSSNKDLEGSRCDETFDEGHIFTFFFYYGQSNYFHLHFDTAIPLYKSAYHSRREGKRLAFLPTVETKRLQVANWRNDAHDKKYKGKYWSQIMKFMAETHSYIPLDGHFLNRNKTLCFKTAYFGSISWKKDEPVIRGYVSYVLNRMGIQRTDPDTHRVGIIKRTNRRKILNEDELAEALQSVASTELVNFDGKTFKEQVEMMQQYTVLIGMNGAGLMNCLFLPPCSVCVQLVPYKAHLNNVQYGELLQARGPYMDWHNTHEELHVRRGGTSHSDDTIVHVEEMKQVVSEALKLAEKTKMEQLNLPKEEL